MTVQTQLGHDAHAHPLDVYTGCSGLLATEADAGDGHGPGQNLYTLITAQYTDGGAAGGVPALTGSTRVQLQPKSKEAEHFSAQSGVTVNDRATARAGKRLGDVDHNDWVGYGPVDLRNVGSVTLGVTNGGLGGTIELRTGSPTGTLIGTAAIGSTGGWDNLVSPTVTLTNKPTGTTTLYAKFVNAAQSGGTPDLLALDWLRFNGAGVKQEPGGTLSLTANPASGTGTLNTTLTATATAPSGQSITDYAWDFGDNSAITHGATLRSIAHNYPRKGTYTARVTTTYTSGETRSINLTVTVN
ncbi:carbohydrate-binding protein [Micromonospora tarensis]|uniref:carbohydrate-binding protein n=1 Tax=Micromonospora tarensis TaxID=2806100 RepID=UPI00281623CD|nr:carbohydrate-binding protein [Micromonospora tarensis]